MLAELTLRELLERAASKQPTPGGGAVAGCLLALGASMGEMAGRYTEGRAGAEAVPATVEQLAALRRRGLELMDADAAAFAVVGEAYGRPKGSPAEKAARAAAIVESLRVAMEPPRQVLAAALEGLRELVGLEAVCNPNLVSDVGVAAHALAGAARSAWLNVLVNLKGLPESAERSAVHAEGAAQVAEAARLEAQVGGAVARRFGG